MYRLIKDQSLHSPIYVIDEPFHISVSAIFPPTTQIESWDVSTPKTPSFIEDESTTQIASCDVNTPKTPPFIDDESTIAFTYDSASIIDDGGWMGWHSDWSVSDHEELSYDKQPLDIKKITQQKPLSQSSKSIPKKKSIKYKAHNAMPAYGPLYKYCAAANILISKKMTEEIIPDSIREIIPNVFDYISESYLKQNKKEFKKHKINIISYGFHHKQTNDILYCVVDTSENKKPKFRMIEELFSAKDVENKYNISSQDLPFYSCLTEIKNDEKKILNLFQNVSERDKFINKLNWCKTPIYSVINNIERMTLKILKSKFKSYVNNCNNNVNLIPILMFDHKRFWVEYIWIVCIKGNNIGIALCVDKKHNIKVNGIHLNKDMLMKQHQLVDIQHMNNCKCFDNFESNITELEIGNVNAKENKIKDLKVKWEESRAVVSEMQIKNENLLQLCGILSANLAVERLKYIQQIIQCINIQHVPMPSAPQYLFRDSTNQYNVPPPPPHLIISRLPIQSNNN